MIGPYSENKAKKGIFGLSIHTIWPLAIMYARGQLFVAPKGELGIFLIEDYNVFPLRWKIRPLGFINLQILP